jgi:hypothetical protein
VDCWHAKPENDLWNLPPNALGEATGDPELQIPRLCGLELSGEAVSTRGLVSAGAGWGWWKVKRPLGEPKAALSGDSKLCGIGMWPKGHLHKPLMPLLFTANSRQEDRGGSSVPKP